MYINKRVTASWTNEEKETIASFREFLGDKIKETQYDLDCLYEILTNIDIQLYDILNMDFEEDC